MRPQREVRPEVRPIARFTSVVVPIDPERPPAELHEVGDLAARQAMDVHLLGLAGWGGDGGTDRAHVADVARAHGIDTASVDVLPSYEPGAAVAAWLTAHPGGVPLLLGAELGGVPIGRVARSLAWWSHLPVTRRVHGGAARQAVAVIERGPGARRAADLAAHWSIHLGVGLTVFAVGDEVNLDWIATLLAAVPADAEVELWPVPVEHVPRLAVADASWVVASATESARRVAFGMALDQPE